MPWLKYRKKPGKTAEVSLIRARMAESACPPISKPKCFLIRGGDTCAIIYSGTIFKERGGLLPRGFFLYDSFLSGLKNQRSFETLSVERNLWDIYACILLLHYAFYIF